MKQWYKNRKKDHFYQLAQKNDLISRAYYKLEEIEPTNPPNMYDGYIGSAQNHQYVIQNVVNVLNN